MLIKNQDTDLLNKLIVNFVDRNNKKEGNSMSFSDINLNSSNNMISF